MIEWERQLGFDHGRAGGVQKLATDDATVRRTDPAG